MEDLNVFARRELERAWDDNLSAERRALCAARAQAAAMLLIAEELRVIADALRQPGGGEA